MNRLSVLAIVLLGYSLFFIVRFPLWYLFLLFESGLLLGYSFHILDRLVQVLLVSELTTQKTHFLSVVKTGHLLKAIKYLVEEVPSVSASFYFVVLYFPLAIYLVSSSGSVPGTGLMLGLGLSYCVHFILSYKKVGEVRRLYFSALSSKVSNADIQKIMAIFIALFLVLSWFVAL